MGEIRTIGKHTLVYGAGAALGKVASFIMLPVYTHYLTTAQYGVLDLLGTTIDVIGMIAGVGLASGVFKFYAEMDNERDRREVVSTVALGSMALALITTAVGMLFSGPLTRLVLGADGTPSYFRMFFGIYFLQSVGGIPFMLLRAQERSISFVVLNFCKLVLTLALNIYFLVFRHMGIEGVLLAGLLANGALATVLLVYTFREVGFSFSLEKFRIMTRFGSPLVLWSVGSFLLTFSDRYFLKYYDTASTVGIYSLAYKFSFLLSAFAVDPFGQIWEPRRFAIAKRPDAGEIYSRVFTYFNIAMFGGAILILLFVKDVLRIMVAPAFWGAYHVIPLLLATTVVQQWTGYCNIGLYLKDATRLYAWSAVIGVIAVLGLNALLIPRFGMFGAAWATIGAYVVRFAAVYSFSQAKYHIDYPWPKVGVLFGVAVGVYLLRTLVDQAPIVISIAVSVVTLVLLVAAGYRQLLSAAERASVRQIIRWPRSARTVTAV